MTEPESLGAVEIAVIEFPSTEFDGSIAPALAGVINAGTVTILDLVFVTKHADGNVGVLELSELGVAAAPFLELDGSAGGLLSEQDLVLAASVLAPSQSAAVVVWENTWSRRLVRAIADAGGHLLAHDRLDARTVQAALDALESTDEEAGC
jgi:hypothetical protein